MPRGHGPTVGVVAWEQELLDRAGRRLQSWVVSKMSDDEKEALMLRQAIAETDFDTIESYGGFDAVVEMILRWDRKNPVPKDSGSIDSFRLWGSHRCRRIGDRLIK